MKESCPKNVILMKAKNSTFLTFLDKMQFSEILCLATYDWFCADGSHMAIAIIFVLNTLLSVAEYSAFSKRLPILVKLGATQTLST